MENLSPIQPSFPVKVSESLGGRAVSAFDSEINQLIAMTEDAVLPPSNLGGKIDVKA